MFYTEQISESYRLGDIVCGFTNISPRFEKSTNENGLYQYTVTHSIPRFFSILTPCCSIEKSLALIVAIEKVDNNFLVSQYLRDDLLHVNEKMSKREALGSFVFEKVYNTEDKRNEADSKPREYEFADKFVYEENDIFDEYEIRRQIEDQQIIRSVKYKMINFKKAFSVEWEMFNRNTACIKVLELSPYGRKLLRDKINHFFGRVPDEDVPFLPERNMIQEQ